MEAPDPQAVAHDLRNVIGMVRSMALDLKHVVAHEPAELPARLVELDAQTDLAMEALRVVECREQVAAGPVHLGAWAWALRLWVRSLAVGDMAGVPRVRIALAPALASGVALVRALHPARPVTVERVDGAVKFESSTSACDERALREAVAALAACGLHATIERATPCVVRVGGGG